MPLMRRFALAQLEASGEVRQRRSRARDAIRYAGDEGADLVVLPELWAVGAFETASWVERAETLDGPTAQLASEAAREAGVIVHAGSIIERAPREDGDGDALYNTALVFGRDGALLASYRKIHLFAAGGREAELLTGGDTVSVIDLPLGADDGPLRTGLSTCYDLRFPELYRQQTLDVPAGRARLFILCASWRVQARPAWHTLTTARAAENQCVVLAAGAAGWTGKQELAAQSLVIAADGTVLAEAGIEPTTLLADVDLKSVEEIRAALPVHADRRLG